MRKETVEPAITTPGIHHVTAICGDPQANVDFYASVLGLRLVKRTVNFDDPTTYHLYYGDEVGHPGTILTFFPWPGAPRGVRGTGQTTATAFAVPPGSLDWWTDRLARSANRFEKTEERFGERVLPLRDPDDLAIELVERRDAAERPWWEAGPVTAPYALRGFHGVTLTLEGYERTAALLTDVMGLEPAGQQENRWRYAAAQRGAGAMVDLICAPGLRAGRVAVGTVHHVAFRCATDAEQTAWQRRLADAGMNVTPVLDRQYFRSIYFREPGGVLFEIATDPPGFTRDEAPEALGNTLRLPPWLEPRRTYIEDRLPRLQVPAAVRAT
ncbi:MAG: ring-cleaving dioxygenase [Candidatus Rokuibacteriota bacterium]|nr:MAG: ring-cleaving dioxygenase [Candidatus Rokubacteria bacterium]